MGVGAAGSIIECKFRDEGHDRGGESSIRGTGASMGGSAGMSVGTHVDLLMGLSHLGNCTSENLVCAAVTRTLLGEHINKKLALFPGAIPRYSKFICPNISQKTCGTFKYMQVINSRLLAMKCFIWCMPLKAGQGV